MKNLFLAFGLAWNMLSIIPLFKIHTFFRGINALSAMFYPFVGALLGGIVTLFYLTLEPYVPIFHLLVLTFGVWIILTGALHLDGLSDTIDGFFVPKQKALEVMKDSHVGGMGMIFSVLFLIVKLSSFLALHNPLFIIAIMSFSRFYVLGSIFFFPYVSSGVGALLKEELKLKHLFVSFVFGVSVAFYFNALFIFLLGALFSIAIAFLLAKRLGGLNGDSYGFIIETSELFLLNILLFV